MAVLASDTELELSTPKHLDVMLSAVIDCVEERLDRAESGWLDVEPLRFSLAFFDCLDTSNQVIPRHTGFLTSEQWSRFLVDFRVFDECLGKALDDSLVKFWISRLIDCRPVVLTFEVECSDGVAQPLSPPRSEVVVVRSAYATRRPPQRDVI